ncbi:DNA-deoxyinosine glycosylase [Campylobacter concisus]|uniref:DNA-deoxyinosine glycosylase n=1 Tax=Campylobacter concisus TaxID=199 RepID=UPI0018A9F181|nr:DNA-deoxyinosine glycosylase [Campylobacter concisus]QPI00018.1 DNA-deoxyinosine glycosylase [Campylobacter concisus]QPI01808.1 DNA-deoxyinosine glycosylase [Campylobacter concisus]
MSQTHPFKPIFDKNSKILILGSFPSVVSRRFGFYYANPQNRFWRVLAGILNAPLPTSTDEKINFLLAHRIAIYDAAISCEIKGSSDAKMTAVAPANLEPIFKTANITQVYANGGKAHEICEKYLKNQILNATGKSPVKLPSTSPANANFSFERLVREWTVVVEALKDG